MQQQAATRAQNAQIDFQNMQAEQEFQYNTLQAQSARTGEAQQKQLQEDVIAQNLFLANEAYESDIAALNLRMMQEDAAASAEKRKTSIAAMQAKGEIVAAGRVGNSIQNLIADVQRQQAVFDYATDQNLAFTGKQLQEQKRGAGVERASRIASQQPYLERTILDPMKPIKRQHVKGPGLAGFLSAGLSGVSTGFTTNTGLKNAGLWTKAGGYTF
jgi:Rps23 Pro-64 3,4-dihydroxylase Tpa1-like proline 4-hydroxylase